MRAISAEEIAVSMGLRVLSMPFGTKRGITARFAQYTRFESGRNVCMAEVINAQRNKYTPKQCAVLCRR